MSEKLGDRLALVTGCFGFLGGLVVEQLVKSGWRVAGIGHGRRGVPVAMAVEGEVNAESVRGLIASFGVPQLVVHCAGTGSVGRAQADPFREFQRSVGVTAEVIEAIRTDAPEAVLVYPSSAAVYGESGKAASQEDDPLRPVSVYGSHKIACEELVRSAARDQGLTTRIVRFFSLYGEGLRKQLLWDTCTKLSDGRLDLSMFGTGEERRDFMHGRDAARLIERLADPSLGPFVLVNGGTGTATTVRTIADHLARATGHFVNLHFDGGEHHGNPKSLVADTTRLRQVTGFKPEVQLPAGIAAYARWALNQLGMRQGLVLPDHSTVKLTVVVGTCDRCGDLSDLLDSIEAHTHTPHLVVVSDAGSTDGTIEMLERRQQANLVVVREGERRGQAKALNEVFARVQTPYVCWVSDDNLITEGGLDDAVEILENDPGIGMVGLKVRDLVGPFIDAPYIGGIGVAGVLNVNQGVLPTTLLRELGGFDEELRDYGIDPDLTLRVLKAGRKVVFTKDVAILHRRGWPSDRNSPEAKRLAEKHERARKLLAAKHKDLGGDIRGWKMKLFCWRAMRAVPVLRPRLNINAPRPLLGFIPRDWYNAFNARWVHPLDPLRTRRKKYHLVQRMRPET
ncbi:MAG TPA: NAD-dependent epimerase/dehydratase family protein [Geminicoccus sp.]|jgi:nucleoside-diphosphate-sugar epimerase/GT2 family glycosyltransferase|uniref:NAD-dependent epimerase/dehydratase family protein n=1 Tax=Geminicoccus sp. TaxID=2024832 RepID=UPI002E34E7ED|nr:NAD-dependent epimerase/dehydratase family protein [Geminicoccus sp.]HEX2528343.1 NAD-dependent epimerase/dehydratase family protein [Geminicoccus sp.]